MIFTYNRAEQLPSNRGAFLPHAQRAHCCAKILKTSDDLEQKIWYTKDFGWVETGGRNRPFMTSNGPATDGNLNAVKCSCKIGYGTNRCSCKKMEKFVLNCATVNIIVKI
jgi:hypothetical protein